MRKIIISTLFLFLIWSAVHAQNEDIPPGVSDYRHIIIYAQFVIGQSFQERLKYESILQITNKSSEEWEGRWAIHGTGTEPWSGNFAVRDHRPSEYSRPRGSNYLGNNNYLGGGQLEKTYLGYLGEWGDNITLKPHATKILNFEGDQKIRSGWLEVVGRIHEPQEIATSLFFRITNPRTEELLDSVGVSPSDHGCTFITPVQLKKPFSNTGIAVAYIPKGRVTEIEYHLRDLDGELVGGVFETVAYKDNISIHPYHSARFITEIFPRIPDEFEGSLEIRAQRNINVMVLRHDIQQGNSWNASDGDIQLTSVPVIGTWCDDYSDLYYNEDDPEYDDPVLYY